MIVNVKCNKAIDIYCGKCDIQLYGRHGHGNQQFDFASDGSIESAVGCSRKESIDIY